MISSEYDIDNLIEGFKLSCQAEGKSYKTVEWYYCFLKRFSLFLRREKLSDSIIHINQRHVRLFINYLQTQVKTPFKNTPLSPASIQGYVRTLKAFFSWATREEYIKTNPMEKVPVPKAVAKIVNTFSDEQIIKLTCLCNSNNGSGYRNFTIILILLDAGLRISELVGIELDDVNLADGYLKIRLGKGKRERLVPIGSIVQKALWRYINRYRTRPLTGKITRLFLNDRGLPLTRNGVQQMLRRYGKRAGITGVRCSPHTFRHTFAKKYLLNGGDIFSLQNILGHSSLASVRIYLNLFSIDIKKKHLCFSPVDNMAENRSFNKFSIPADVRI